jgi:Family of unknown function (DUF5946)
MNDYDELCAYTIAHAEPAFIHQHVVDAWAAQNAGPDTKPVALTMALVGLYLHVEQRMNGLKVQRAHMQLAKKKREWPEFDVPAERGRLTASDVMARPEGPERDRAIHDWAVSVWRAFSGNRAAIVQLLREAGVGGVS